MADYRLSAKIIGRSSGRSSVAAAAYRAGAELHDERTGLDHDYTRKGGVLHSEILAPDDAPDWMKDRAKLWNAVEAVERRKDAQLAREIQLSLPHELDETQNREMLFGFIQAHFVDRGMIADVAIHAPDRQGDQRNFHAHVMLTTRVLTDDGFGKKNRAWNTSEQLAEWRENWADHQNQVFRDLGMEQHVDHRSYADQGIDREATQHRGPVANDMERRGKRSRVGDENRARQQRNAERAALAQERAQASQAVAKEKDRQEETTRTAQANQQAQMRRAEIELSNRHAQQSSMLDDQLRRQNDGRRRHMQAEQQKLEEQLRAEGWRKLMRDLLGKTRRDQEQLEAARRDLEAIRMREDSARQALQAQQDAERQAQVIAQQQRDAAQAREAQQKLEQDRAAARTRNNAPAQDRSQAPQKRPHAAEQDNTRQRPQDFSKAARGADTASPGPSDQQRAVDDMEAMIRRQRENRQNRNRDRGPQR